MKELIVILIGILIGLVVLVFTRQIELAIVTFLSLYLLWHVIQFFLYKTYLVQQLISSPRKGFGIWEKIYAHTQQLKREKQSYRHRLFNHRSELIRLANTLDDAIILLNEYHELLWANLSAKSLLGISFEQHKGLKIEKILKDKTFNDILNKSNFNQPYEILSPVNQSMILSNRIYRSQAESSDLIVVISSDITQVFFTEQSQKDFVTNVSHELRSPLTVIKGFIELIADSDQQSEDLNKPIQLMQLQTKRMENLIDSLMLLSRIQQKDSFEKDEQINVGHMLNEIVNQAETLYAVKKPIIGSVINDRVQLIGSKTYIFSVFSNLVFNAILHNAAQCQIDLSWNIEQNGQGVFIVKDSGEGIATRHLNRLTERFYRIDKSRTQSDANSTGLGLAIVKQAMEYHQGKLTIDSKPGVGSTFCCIFPKTRIVEIDTFEI